MSCNCTTYNCDCTITVIGICTLLAIRQHQCLGKLSCPQQALLDLVLLPNDHYRHRSISPPWRRRRTLVSPCLLLPQPPRLAQPQRAAFLPSRRPRPRPRKSPLAPGTLFCETSITTTWSKRRSAPRSLMSSCCSLPSSVPGSSSTAYWLETTCAVPLSHRRMTTPLVARSLTLLWQPFNAFLSGFSASVGQFVLTGGLFCTYFIGFSANRIPSLLAHPDQRRQQSRLPQGVPGEVGYS